MDKGPIVLYDADCMLCSRLVQFIVKRDKGRAIRFASLASVRNQMALHTQSPAQQVLPDSLIVIEGGRMYTHSKAALRITRYLNQGWKMAYAFIIVPPFIRDAVYRMIAARRYRISRRWTSCPVPDEQLRSRLLGEEDAAEVLLSVL